MEKRESEKTKSERDRFERIIQTLQIKYQPQQREIVEVCTGSEILGEPRSLSGDEVCERDWTFSFVVGC
jgi:hypothetical protein